jgi:hypothetical protein
MTTTNPTAGTPATTDATPALVIRFITATKLIYNEKCSFRFMFTSNMPGAWVGKTQRWGFVALAAKDADFLNLFALGDSPERISGDDGTPRWNIFLFKSGVGQVMNASFDDSPNLEGWTSLLKDKAFPEGTLLCIERALYDRIAPVLEAAGVTVEAHHHDGELHSS